MPHALIVDDVAENRCLLEALLRGSGYEVTSASNGSEALEVARHERPDLVISDILMPDMDGFALCRAWKEDARLKSVPFVFYTATYTDPKDERLALSLGADRYIVKPLEPEAFVDAINDVVEKDRQHKLSSRPPELRSEAIYLRKHNEALVRKLGRKLRQLADANRALSTEIDVRKQMEAELRERKEHFRRVVERSPMPIAVVGEHDDIVQVNEQFRAVFGYAREDVPDLATFWAQAVPDKPLRRDVVRSWRKELETAARERRDIEPREVILRGKNGTVHTVEMHVAAMCRNALLLFNDITERRRLEVLRDQFLAAAAHELKTPVTTIKGYSQLLLRWTPVEDRALRERVAITSIDAQCDRIQRRVDEMLAAARYRTGLAPIRAERLDLGALVQDIVRRLQATAEGHRLLFERPGPVVVEVDPERLDEALATLIDRTMGAVAEGADVRVRLGVEGKEARLSIMGRGLVLPKDEEAMFFEPLCAPRAGDDARQLTMAGLGPYLAKLAIDHQNGRIWVERSGRDGVIVVVALPLAED